MKIACEFSGGADSTYAAILAKKKFSDAEIIGVFIDYGQVCKEQELKCVEKLKNKLDIAVRVIKIENNWNEGGMIDGQKEGTEDVYTPCRNLALLGSVIAFADSILADVIITGSKGLVKVEQDGYSYYDSTVAFYKMMEGIWNYVTENKRICKIIPILAENRTVKMSKREVYEG